MKLSCVLFSLVLLATCALPAFAEDSSQPYIDSIKQNLVPSDSTGYSDKIKSKLSPDDSEGYTERLKNSGDLKLEGTPGSYTDEVRKKLKPAEEGGAIEAYRQGHSELHLKKEGEVDSAFGFGVGVGMGRTVVANQGLGTGRDFNEVYGQTYAPDLSLFFERQLGHHETWGSFGLYGLANIAWFSGDGIFATKIKDAYSNQDIDSRNTHTRFMFYEVPASIGGSVRFNLAKYLRPYVMGGPAVVGASETRNDGGSSHYILSHGLWGAAGVAVLMDWVSQSGDWNRYADFGIKHSYLTVQYTYLKTFSSPVDFSVSGAVAGFTFEY